MLDKGLLAKTTINYSEEQLEAIANGFCPQCLPQFVRYRILETQYHEGLHMELHRVKCNNLVECDWDEQVPTVRVDNGLEGFFES